MKQVRICLGRFQPFTGGHLKMATYKCKGPETIQGFKEAINQKELLREQPDINEINKQKTLILVIKVEDEQVDKKHPFPYSLMKEEMDIVKSLPEIEDVMFVDSADICKWGEMIKKAGYQASVWITGSDEAKPYVEMAMKVPEYEEHNRDNRDCKDAYTKSFYVESITRTDNSEDFSETISGTKVREALLNDDKEYFKKAMPKGCDKLFDKFKEALSNPNLPEVYKKPKVKKIKEYLNNKMKSLTEYIYESFVNEGGNVQFNGDASSKIAKDDIKPTLDAWIKEMNRLFPEAAKEKVFDNPQTLGSVGKKDFSGDIDIAIDAKFLTTGQGDDDTETRAELWGLDPQHISELYEKYKKRARTAKPNQLAKRAVIVSMCEYINEHSDLIAASDKQSGGGTLFTQIDQIDSKTGKPNGLKVQIDCNFGDVDWLTFAYYSDSYKGNVKGLHRTQLMLHMFAYKNYTMDHGKGVKNKETQEMEALKPEQAVELLNKLYNFNITRKILENYFTLQDYLREHVSEKDLNGIYDIYLKTLDSTRCDIPEDLQPYWIENQERIGLKGGFLPDDSALAPLRKEKR